MVAKEVKKLKAVQINSLSPGTHSDGDNHLLRVRESGSAGYSGINRMAGQSSLDWAR